jgi:hypothetical protein
MSLDLSVVQGSAADWVLQAINRDGTVPTGFLISDVLAATVWTGQNQTSLFSPAVNWSDSTSGKVALSVTSAQTTGLDQAGDYHLQVTATRLGKTVTIIDCSLRILAAAGSGTQAVNPYCAYSDLLLYGPWVTLIQQFDTDQEGFYSQRLAARKWLDELIIRSWRGTSQAYFGDAGRTAQFWLGGWVRRTSLMSQWLTDKLTANQLLVKDHTVRICTFKSLSLIGLTQIGKAGQFAQHGSYYEDLANSEASTYVAELDLNGDGIADLPIPLGSTNTLFT